MTQLGTTGTGTGTDPAWLDIECRRLLDFGRRFPHPTGGAGWLDNNGAVDLSRPVHTYITARMAHVYCLADLLGDDGGAALADQALTGLTGPLRDPEHGGWFTQIAGTTPVPDIKSCYDHAFVVLAASSGTVADRPGARDLLDTALDVLNERFWDEAEAMYVDHWDRSFSTLSPYRGVNANMHAVEALLAATDANGDTRWRLRALGIAHRVTEFARRRQWRIPEHFTPAWDPLFDLNRDRPDDPFQPFGATIGHGMEWSRLMLHLHAGIGQEAPGWLTEAAVELFDRAVTDGWAVDGAPGFVYTTDWSGRPVVRQRMHWVLAEAVAAAAALHRRTGNEDYLDQAAGWWDYARQYLVDREHGSWHHELDPENRPAATVWPGKPDLYHAVQATLLPRLPLAPGLALTLRTGRCDVPDDTVLTAPAVRAHRRRRHPGDIINRRNTKAMTATTPTEPLAELAVQGISLWLDDLSRQRLTSGNLLEIIGSKHIVGVTTNPSIFAAALSDESYEPHITALADRGASVDAAVRELTTDDVRAAADLFAGVYHRSAGVDGRVSIEVDPRVAHDTDATIEQAKELFKIVDRNNVLIKIPATLAGLPAITAVIAEGIGVNVTLIFSRDRYAAVMDAYILGLEQAKANGHNLSHIHSVASFFVSRVDLEIDKRLKAIDTPEATALLGKAAIANARLAYQLAQQKFAGDRWDALAAAGANPQRPLWASTGVKDPAYDDTRYVVELVAPGAVNTAPEGTIDAVADHGTIRGNTIEGTYEESAAVFTALRALGVDLDNVYEVLETEGVQKFEQAWTQLLASVNATLEQASTR